ncbi:MAG: hypothetical protein GX868_00170 [Actinobacteria bacterium]|nr:hypothetical protein [Actinomycetota bacterium]
MNALGLLSAVAFDPTIRGVMVVVVSTLLWGGSLYTILMTNTGVRVGFLLAMSGTFGWCFLMGTIWTIYGIGLIGRAPAWMITDVNHDRNVTIEVEAAKELPAHADLADPIALLDEYPLLKALAWAAEGEGWEPSSLTKLKTVIQPWVTVSTRDVIDVARNAEANAAEVLASDAEAASLIDGALNGGKGDDLRDAVRSQSRELRDEIAAPLGDWCLLTESDPRRGEAQASADAAFAEANAFPGRDGATDTSDYLIQNVFLYGGKEPCDPITEKSSFDQALHRIATTIEVKNPTMYAAATALRGLEYNVEPGSTPPRAAIDPAADSEVTAVMLRNLGNKRFIPFCFALVNLIGFAIFTTILHYRDKQAMAVRAAFAGAGKGK